MKNNWIRIISILEMVGGVIGICSVVWWFAVVPFNLISFLLSPILIGIYVLSFIAGLLLWRESPYGRITSIIVQSIQIPKIFSPIIVFMFSFGFDLWLHLVILDNKYLTYGFELKLLAFHQLFINSQNAPLGFGFSITALVFLIMLLKYKTEDSLNDEETLPPPLSEILEKNDEQKSNQ
jgi:hypothetical protein